MSEYWVSQERKFCELCKCWMAGNKISIQIHENGSRHLASVQQRLTDIQKKSVTKSKDNDETEDNLKKMNEGALESMMKDLVQDPSLAKRYGIQLSGAAQSELESRVASLNKRKLRDDQVREVDFRLSEAAEHGEDASGGCGSWVEARAPEGHVYFWNSVTKETRWTRPVGVGSAALSGVVLSGVDPEEDSLIKKEKDRLSEFYKRRGVGAEPKEPEEERGEDTAKGKEEVEEKPRPAVVTVPPHASSSSSGPYGSWQVVDDNEHFRDLGLPKASESREPALFSDECYEDNAPVLEVTEKKVVSLKRGKSGSSSKKSVPSKIVFKKPRGSRNIRSKDDDDD